MSIIWKYLDKRAATVAAIKDYESMQFIITNTSDDVKQEKERMGNLTSPQFDGMPHSHDPQSGEDRLIRSIDEIDVLKERYRQAMEYMDWFLPAWGELSEEEQYVLEAFYSDDGYGTSAVYVISDHFGIERSSAYNKKNRALSHLQTLLFGKA